MSRLVRFLSSPDPSPPPRSPKRVSITIRPRTNALRPHPRPLCVPLEELQTRRTGVSSIDLADIQTQDAHAGVVRNYTAPTPPQAPVLPTDLAAELSKFDAEEPSLGAAPVAVKSSSEEAGEGAAEYLSFLEKDLPSEEAHH
jgi:hypothetical protein